MAVESRRLWSTAMLVSVAAGLLMQLVTLNSPFVGDEASNEQVCLRIAGEGKYASEVRDGPPEPGKSRGLEFDGYITTGPTVLYPAGLAYRFLGRGPAGARLVMLAYYLLALWFFHRFTRRLFDGHAAHIALTILATCPLVLEAGHRLLGEMAAICFLFAGLLPVLRYAESRRFRWLVPAALLLGLAGVSKVLALIGVFGVALWLAGLALARLRQEDGRGFAAGLAETLGFGLLAALPMLLWFTLIISTIGWDGFRHNYFDYTLGFFGGGRNAATGGAAFGFLLKLLPRLSWVTWVANNGALAVIGALAAAHCWWQEERRPSLWLLFTVTVACFWLANGMHRYSLYFTCLLICIIGRYAAETGGRGMLDLRDLAGGGSVVTLACLALAVVQLVSDVRFIYLGEPGREYWFAVTYHSLRVPFWEMF